VKICLLHIKYKISNSSVSIDQIPIKIELIVPVLNIIDDYYYSNEYRSEIFFNLIEYEINTTIPNTNSNNGNDNWKIILAICIPMFTISLIIMFDKDFQRQLKIIVVVIVFILPQI